LASFGYSAGLRGLPMCAMSVGCYNRPKEHGEAAKNDNFI